MIFGYERVSTAEQNLGRQREQLVSAGVVQENIYSDKVSGKNIDRPALSELLKRLRAGDELVVCSLDRLGRNTRDMVCLIEDLNDMGVELRFLKEGIDTKSDMGKVLITVIAAIAQMERENIKERQRQGIELAKKEGRALGRPKRTLNEKEFKAVLDKVEGGLLTAWQGAKLLGISRATFYRRMQEMA